MKKKVLIITHTNEDNDCVETVTRSLDKLGAEVVRLNVDRYPTEYLLASQYKNGRWEVLLDNGNDLYCLNDFAAIWNRRLLNFGACLNKEVSNEYIKGCYTESRKTFWGMLTHLESDVFFMNGINILDIASNKEAQLRVASDLAIQVPQTCITNNPRIAKEFIESYPNGVVSKLQHNFKTYEDGEEGTVFTNEVTDKDLERLESLRYCPMQFQEKIEKKLELRIIIVGNKCYSFALDSQSHEEGKVDWRKVGAKTLTDWKWCEIPRELEEKLIQYQQYFYMNYGAADFILTPEGEYVFLEVNPGGEFFWLDRILNFEISDQIAKVLLGQASRNTYSTYKLPTSIKN